MSVRSRFGLKKCAGCRRMLDRGLFAPTADPHNPLDPRCRACRAETERRKEIQAELAGIAPGRIEAYSREIEARTAEVRAEKIARGEGPAARHWEVPAVRVCIGH